MSDNILVIGATGSIGLEVAKRLVDLNESVKVAVRDPERAKSINLSGVEFVAFDYHQPETFETVFLGIDKVLLVSPPSYLNLEEKVISAVETAIKKGVKHFVNISAISIDSELDKPLKKIENYLKDSDADTVFLRPNCYMQNFKDLFRDLIIEENQISVPAKNSKICFVDVRDVADVAVKALTDETLKNNTYNLTGGKSLNMHVVAHLFSEELNRDIEYNDITEEYFEKSLKAAGWPAGTIKGTIDLCSHVKSGETDFVSNDIKNILGREPIKFEQFVKDYSDNWA
jgi:uncharacterized protein YbjT (DUF2867 family)